MRSSLSEAEIQKLSNKILDQVKQIDFSNVSILHLFLPIEEKNEPNTFLIIDWLTQMHPAIKIIVPKSDFDTALMTNHEYIGRADLRKNIYNILEPQKSLIHNGEVDLVFIPLLSFDKRGYRVGYGKGFYDRFLEHLKTRKIGISFFKPVDEIEDVHERDIRLDACITPDKIYHFTMETQD